MFPHLELIAFCTAFPTALCTAYSDFLLILKLTSVLALANNSIQMHVLTFIWVCCSFSTYKQPWMLARETCLQLGSSVDMLSIETTKQQFIVTHLIQSDPGKLILFHLSSISQTGQIKALVTPADNGRL